MFLGYSDGGYLKERGTLTCLERVQCYSNSGEGEVTSLLIALGKVCLAKAVLSPGCVVGDGDEARL